MSKELERLTSMRNANKISESEYEMLSAALNKKSFCMQIENSTALNPFAKIAGFKALLAGLLLMIAMSLIAVKINVFIDGSFGYVLAKQLRTPVAPGFWLLIYQNLAACLTISVSFLAASLFYRQKRIRIVDFFGTVALSRYPLLISLLFTMLFKHLRPETYNQDLSKGVEIHLSLLGQIDLLFFMSCFIWQIMTYFFALKEASGLDGSKLWKAFIVSILFGDMLATIFTRWFLYS